MQQIHCRRNDRISNIIWIHETFWQITQEIFMWFQTLYIFWRSFKFQNIFWENLWTLITGIAYMHESCLLWNFEFKITFSFTDSISCTFDYDLCGWVQQKDDQFDFTRRLGRTLSPGTGPNTDHTSGSMYTEHPGLHVMTFVEIYKA